MAAERGTPVYVAAVAGDAAPADGGGAARRMICADGPPKNLPCVVAAPGDDAVVVENRIARMIGRA